MNLLMLKIQGSIAIYLALIKVLSTVFRVHQPISFKNIIEYSSIYVVERVEKRENMH